MTNSMLIFVRKFKLIFKLLLFSIVTLSKRKLFKSKKFFPSNSIFPFLIHSIIF